MTKEEVLRDEFTKERGFEFTDDQWRDEVSDNGIIRAVFRAMDVFAVQEVNKITSNTMLADSGCPHPEEYRQHLLHGPDRCELCDEDIY